VFLTQTFTHFCTYNYSH